MDHTGVVREGDRLAEALEDPQQFGPRGSGGQQLSQGAAAHPLHDVEQPAISQSSGVVNGNDAGVFEACEDPRLELQAALDRGFFGVVRDLDRDVSSQLAI